MASGIELGFKW